MSSTDLWGLLVYKLVQITQAPVLMSWAQAFFSGMDVVLNKPWSVDGGPGFSKHPFPAGRA